MSQTILVRKAILAILRSLETETSAKVARDIMLGSVSDITRHRVDPHRYTSASDFAPDYLATSIARKWQGLSQDDAVSVSGYTETSAVARSAFFEQERCNAQFNVTGPTISQSARAERRSAIDLMAQRYIADALGTFNPVEFARQCSFSSGASYGLPRKYGAQPFKYVHGELEVTSEAYPIARLIVEQSPLWTSSDVTFKKVAGSRLATVPKDATTDRLIVIDPRMNIYLQKGLGSIMRAVLMKVGIDLSDQSVNRHLAYIGSIRNEFGLCTIDLVGASNSVTYRRVMELLPKPWFDVLYATRSHRVVLDDGSLHELEMFSGMGNGYTFELETLMFWALSKAAIEYNNPVNALDRTCKVYGDDIVVPSRHYDIVTETLEDSGFTINQTKSFHYGGFRESCGGHYFLGRDVTPFYIKDATDQPMDLIQIANAYHAWCKRNPEWANQGVFDYLCSLAQKTAKGKMGMVPARDGLRAGLIWSPINQTLDKATYAIRKNCRRLPKYATILVDTLGAACVRDNDYQNIGSCYQYRRFEDRPVDGIELPDNGRLLQALQTMEQTVVPAVPFVTSLKGKTKTRTVKTTTWCEFTPLFNIPPCFL